MTATKVTLQQLRNVLLPISEHGMAQHQTNCLMACGMLLTPLYVNYWLNKNHTHFRVLEVMRVQDGRATMG